MNVKVGKIFEYIALSVVFLSVIVLVLETVEGFPVWTYDVLGISSDFFAIFFLGEYLLRVGNTQRNGFSSKKLMGYAFSFFGLIDLVSVLPTILPFLFGANLGVIKMFRILRVFRIMKFGRYSRSVQMLGEVIVSVRYALFSTLFVSLFVILFSASSMYYLEHDAQPNEFKDIPSTFWWAMATLTTVGYGDVYPITTGGKMFASVVALTGIGLVAIPTGLLSAAFTKRIAEDRKGQGLNQDAE
ncbi:ion transporter [bacterium]|nr:ion transporter [bacterium]